MSCRFLRRKKRKNLISLMIHHHHQSMDKMLKPNRDWNIMNRANKQKKMKIFFDNQPISHRKKYENFPSFFPFIIHVKDIGVYDLSTIAIYYSFLIISYTQIDFDFGMKFWCAIIMPFISLYINSNFHSFFLSLTLE